MEVVLSGALPKFSTMNHALAVWLGRPWPVEAFIPVAPVRSNPRVRKTSICTSRVVLTVGSAVRASTKLTTPDSSPRAVEGMLASKVTVWATSGTSSRVRGALLANSNVQPSGSWVSSYVRVQSAVLDPVAIMSTWTCCDVPGGILGVSSGPASSAR